jgi:hypothetical protein
MGKDIEDAFMAKLPGAVLGQVQYKKNIFLFLVELVVIFCAPLDHPMGGSDSMLTLASDGQRVI